MTDNWTYYEMRSKVAKECRMTAEERSYKHWFGDEDRKSLHNLWILNNWPWHLRNRIVEEVKDD